MYLLRDVEENVSMVALKHRFNKVVIPFKKERELVGEMIDDFAIKTPSFGTEVKTLSGGNQQKSADRKVAFDGPGYSYL